MVRINYYDSANSLYYMTGVPDRKKNRHEYININEVTNYTYN